MIIVITYNTWSAYYCALHTLIKIKQNLIICTTAFDHTRSKHLSTFVSSKVERNRSPRLV